MTVLEGFDPVETMQRTNDDGSKVKRIVLALDAHEINLVWLTVFEGGEHDGRMQVSVQSDSDHEGGQSIEHFLTREQTDAVREWLLDSKRVKVK